MEAVLTLKASGRRRDRDGTRTRRLLRKLASWKRPEKPTGPADIYDTDLERARMLLHTLSHFWKGAKTLRLTVITPTDDVLSVQEALAPSAAVSVTVVDENELIPFLHENPRLSNWYKQQALKLAYASLTTEEFFLTLDADLLCTREFSDESLVVDKKALTDWEPRSRHPEWWTASAKLLRLAVQTDDPGFSVTPVVLSRTICTRMLNYIKTISRQDCYEYLLANFGWTEYSLYNVFADNENLTFEYHHCEDWMQKNRKSIRADPTNSRRYHFWSKQQFEAWNGDGAFGPDAQGLFIVCQSNSRILPSAVWNKIKHWFPEVSWGAAPPLAKQAGPD